MENKGDECFKWCVARAMYPTERNQQRMDKTLRKKSEELKWVGMTFLTPLKVIDRFEKQNPTISVNVLSYERDI